MSKQFAVVGNPIEHSRSPELHHAFAQKLGIDLTYNKRLAPLDGFEHNIQDFFQSGGIGLNVTVPFKEQAFALCQQLTERAKIAKAVNTLWMQDGQLYGDNTDGQGLVNAILTLGWSLKNSKIKAKNNKTKVTYYRFTKEDGLYNNEFNGSSNPSGHILQNGSFVFPSMEGFVFFRPEEIKSYYPKNDQFFIERAKIGRNLIKFKDTLRLKNGYNSAEIFLDFP